jgi:tRNA pseudouridine55 synthase
MDAIILVDKPAGITSAEAVRRIKRFVGRTRVGHLGTLDPFATGLLPIMIGEATKLAPFLERGEKEYEGVISLGIETDTLDREGAAVAEAPVPEITADALRDIERRFIGTIEQVPPVYSAIKRDGVRMYDLARRGEAVDPPPARRVEIRALELSVESPQTLRFRLVCSTGTYARSIARDVAIELGTVGHLAQLRRTRSGEFRIDTAVALDTVVESMAERGENLRMLTPAQALGHLPAVSIDSACERQLRYGDSRALDFRVPAGIEVALFSVIDASGRLIAVARPLTPQTAKIERIFGPQ